MVVLVLAVCVGSLSLVVLAILALNLWARVGRLATEVTRAQERTATVLGQLQEAQQELQERRESLRESG